MELKKTRVDWIDITKGIAIILMVAGHMPGLPHLAITIIFSFHMPLFMIINGYLIRDYDISRTFERSCRSLLIPYILVCLIEAVLMTLYSEDNEEAGKLLFCGLDDMVMGMSKTSTMFTQYGSVWLIWFVVCLFLSRNIYVAISDICRKAARIGKNKNKKDISSGTIIKIAMLLTISFAGYFIGTRYAFLPWSLDVAMYSIIFIATGDVLKRVCFFEKWDPIRILIPFAVWIAYLFTDTHIELAERGYPYVFGGAIGAIAGSICMMNLSIAIRHRSVTGAILKWCGRHSMTILAIHCLEMRFLNWERILFSGENGAKELVIRATVRMLVILICSYIVVFLYAKSKQRMENNNDDPAEAFNPKRKEWADAAKGICIIAVIAGHMGIAYINQLVFMWHLPVFFLIAGYFLTPRNGREMAENKIKRLLWPYYATCAVIVALSAVKAAITDQNVISTIKAWTFASLYAAGDNWTEPFTIKGIGAIWFLWALFFAIMIVNHFADRKGGNVWVAVIAFAGWASFNYTGIWMPLSIQAGMLASAYLAIGYAVKRRGFDPATPSIPVLALSIVIGSWSIQHFKGFWLVHNFMGNGWIDFVTSVFSSLVVIATAELICKKTFVIKKTLAFFGTNSLLILCLHIIELNVLRVQPVVETALSAAGIQINEYRFSIMLFAAKLLFVTVGTLLIKKHAYYRSSM